MNRTYSLMPQSFRDEKQIYENIQYSRICFSLNKVEMKINIITQIRVGKYDYKTKKQASTEGYKDLLVHTVSPFSPYVLKNEKEQILENVYQFSRVWSKVYKQKQMYNRFSGTKGWEWKEEVHMDEKGNITPEYWKWREAGMNFHLPVRRPNGFKNDEIKFSLLEHQEGDILDPKGRKYIKLDLVESRKLIYFRGYAKAVKKVKAFKDLKKKIENGYKLQINEVDMCEHKKSYPYYHVHSESIPITKDIIKAMLTSYEFPFCHSYCLAVLLYGKEEWVIREPFTREEVAENIDKFFGIKDPVVFEKMNWEYEKKMWNLTNREGHHKFHQYFKTEGSFNAASEEDKENNSTCCYTTVGMLKEFLCGEDTEWITYILSRLQDPPLVLQVSFISTSHGLDVPDHELIIIKGTYVVQSYYEKFKQQITRYNWKDIYPILTDVVKLGSAIVPVDNHMNTNEYKVILKVPKLKE